MTMVVTPLIVLDCCAIDLCHDVYEILLSLSPWQHVPTSGYDPYVMICRYCSSYHNYYQMPLMDPSEHAE